MKNMYEIGSLWIASNILGSDVQIFKTCPKFENKMTFYGQMASMPKQIVVILSEYKKLSKEFCYDKVVKILSSTHGVVWIGLSELKTKL